MIWALGAAGLLLAGFLLIKWQTRRARITYLKEYEFHSSIIGRVSENYMFLSDEELDRIFDGLRDYFIICLKAKNREVVNPSKAVDEAWQTFSLFTREYERFCQRVLGRFLPYIPVEKMRASRNAKEGIKTAWRLACKLEDIEPRDPDRLPRLFAIDSELEIPEGFIYPLTTDTRMPSASGGGFSSSELLDANGRVSREE